MWDCLLTYFGIIEKVIYPVVSQKTLRDLVAEYKATGTAYRQRVHTIMRTSFAHRYRRMIPQLLSALEFRSNIDKETLQKRLLLCLYGMGTNTGLKRINTGINGESYQDLLYVRRRYIHSYQLRSAIASVINAIFSIRLPHIWGEGTTTCASDSKHFGAWDQNLMTQYHLRYGGRGVMIYWHVEKKSTCI